MSFIKAKEHLIKYGYEKNIIKFNVSSATVKEASIALNCEEGMIAKTLSFLVKNKAILIVIEGSYKIDNSKYKKEFGCKAKMIDYVNVEAIIGHKAGGVCPFGINENIEVYLDIISKHFSFGIQEYANTKSYSKNSISHIKTSECKVFKYQCSLFSNASGT